MASTSINVGKFGINSDSSGNVLLTTRPDLRILKAGFLAAALIAVAGAVVYLLPIDDSLKVAFLPLAVLFVVVLAYFVIMYEALGNTVFVVANDHIEEKGGVIWKTQHRIPLTYVRDVTYDQNFLQAMFGVSSVTVSPTNGRKIVLSNVSDGERTREAIWSLVLSKSPGAKPD
jgi:membrane protein YdbS with pleckstrin-like domain